MDDQPIPRSVRDAIIERGCAYFHAIDRTLDPQSRTERSSAATTAPTGNITGGRRLLRRLRSFLAARLPGR